MVVYRSAYIHVDSHPSYLSVLDQPILGRIRLPEQYTLVCQSVAGGVSNYGARAKSQLLSLQPTSIYLIYLQIHLYVPSRVIY